MQLAVISLIPLLLSVTCDRLTKQFASHNPYKNANCYYLGRRSFGRANAHV